MGGPELSCPSNDINLFLDDEAPVALEGSCAPGDGDDAFPLPAYFPGSPPPPLLATFDGDNLASTWVLTVSDNSALDIGTLHRFCLAANVVMIFTDGFELASTSDWSAATP